MAINLLNWFKGSKVIKNHNFTMMKSVFKTTLFTILTLFTMSGKAQNFKTIQAGKFNLDVFNASENSFGVASVIVSGKTDAVLIDAQFTLADAETVAQKIKTSGKTLKRYIYHIMILIFISVWKFSKDIFPE
jgi:chaperonin GroEL (HSP60 family)